MRLSNWTPSIVPRGDDHDVYLVVDDLGRLGRVWREANYEATDRETVITDLLSTPAIAGALARPARSQCPACEDGPPRPPEGFKTGVDKDGWRH